MISSSDEKWKNHKYYNKKLHTLTKTELQELQGDINKIMGKHRGPPPVYEAYFYLFLGFSYAAAAYFFTNKIVEMEIFPYWLMFIFYSIVAGTIWTGAAWTKAHTCGHYGMFKSKIHNDIVGFVLHSALLVPYFSWQFSHGQLHHKYTNHTTKGETHVPPTKKGARLILKMKRAMGDDAFALLKIAYTFFIGWPMYLIFNVSGGRVQADDRTVRFTKGAWKDHFHLGSESMSDKLGNKVMLSTLGCLATLIAVFTYFSDPMFWYFGPYVVTNSWLTAYTYLQHTHEDMPHFGDDEWTFLKGALSTIDRPYHPIINHLHDMIGADHLSHHICYDMEPRKSMKATEELKELLGPLYNYDDRNPFVALFQTEKRCEYIDSVDGIQWYKSH